ncbi:hypothetical protein [Agreia sp. COWG]|uniref:hypothetical protein n=1 Tax=Agreia sp. COWG TaxID=2773266 RepID=UPI00192919B0|nr:hypothetical protein [Agreia sp. COWG]
MATGTPWPEEALLSAITALNDPSLPFSYSIDGHVVKGSWKFDDPMWGPRLAASGASKNFSYSVRLKAGSSSFRWFEQDAGINNGRYRAYRGYNRGFSINLFTIIVGLVRRMSRPVSPQLESSAPAESFTREQIKTPLNDLLARAGWRNKGVTV